MTKTAFAIRHVAFEDLGRFAPVLQEAGYACRYVEAGIDDLRQPELEKADLLVVLGGPIGADQDHLYRFLGDELTLIEKRLMAQKPVIGVCLGAQLMARALGSRIYPAAAKEIGYAPLTPTPAGQSSSLAALEAAQWNVLHWHGDTFDLPEQAVLLASTAITPNQAFSLTSHDQGAYGLALQFHMEAQPNQIERWLIGHCFELMQTGLELEQIRTDARQIGTAVAQAGAQALRNWLAQIGPSPA